RSQLALKFLDPSFVPITNSLSQELQEKPSRWTFNRTAFAQQRNSATRQGWQAGPGLDATLMPTGSAHSTQEPWSTARRWHRACLTPSPGPLQLLWQQHCLIPGTTSSCLALCGPRIDAADFVFRCNFAPTEAFQRDVGRKTNLTTFNPSILEKYYNNLLTIQDRNNFFLGLKKLDGAILWIPAFFFHTSATVTRTLVDFFVEHRGQLKVQLAWPGNIMQHVNRYWKNKHLSPKRLSTGILMYTLASAICEEIHLYGFWPFGFDPNTREDLPYHYYDKKGTKFTTKWQESHQLPAEFQLLYRMHGEGLAKLTLSHCA
ncbi:Sia-alpha-2,3-Gal-beta-1,4-GlcNAc-R:alpha 2,8-sialyltransferase, partial [Dryobates pubescens]